MVIGKNNKIAKSLGRAEAGHTLAYYLKIAKEKLIPELTDKEIIERLMIIPTIQDDVILNWLPKSWSNY